MSSYPILFGSPYTKFIPRSMRCSVKSGYKFFVTGLKMKIILTVILVIILGISTKRIVYEKIELVRPDRRAELLADLEERTGLKIKHISIGKINFLKDTADITIHYDSPRHDGWDNHEEPVVAVFSSADLDD